MIRIAIIDDAVEIGTQLETILIEITTNKGITIDIDIYYNGKELCEHLQNGEFYDLIFLDIEMPEFTGIDVSKMIRDNLKNDATQIAYISGNKEYAIEIFEYDPLYFVHKPINKEKIEKVFERFEKLNEYSQGTGLGLAISRLIIENLGGKIWVDKDYTEGARFVFTHPLTKKE